MFECFKVVCAGGGGTHNVQRGLELNRVTNGFELWYWERAMLSPKNHTISGLK